MYIKLRYNARTFSFNITLILKHIAQMKRYGAVGGGVKNDSSWHLCAVGATLIPGPDKIIVDAPRFNFWLRAQRGLSEVRLVFISGREQASFV